jgi:hypothetical protein
VIGTSWNEDNRPPTFHAKFLDLGFKHEQNGLYLYPPEQLDNVLNSFQIMLSDRLILYADDSYGFDSSS